MRAGLWCWIGGCGTVGWDTESAILLSLAFYSMPLSLYLAVHRTFIQCTSSPELASVAGQVDNPFGREKQIQ